VKTVPLWVALFAVAGCAGSNGLATSATTAAEPEQAHVSPLMTQMMASVASPTIMKEVVATPIAEEAAPECRREQIVGTRIFRHRCYFPVDEGVARQQEEILRSDLAYNREMQILAEQQRIDQEIARQEQLRRMQEAMSMGNR
jgi:hypothetical protein